MDVVGHHMRNNVGKMHNEMGAIFTTNVSKEIIVTTVKGSLTVQETIGSKWGKVPLLLK